MTTQINLTKIEASYLRELVLEAWYYKRQGKMSFKLTEKEQSELSAKLTSIIGD